ncbi:ATP-binding cassette domain-containing protein [Lysobacter maris]|uniref:ATP-binding cassette domain-containing protein n=1 Tax=Marilutibacter maris TaxID=1605891 RepID=A0A508B4N1_9GAMM|nr:ABC transporter ATP-binding protein [Lysobacter maris]KAB8198266.1 ATP-binding cassette domain-containing protein [Lysobacter maris]
MNVADSSSPAARLSAVTLRYGAVQALDGVDIELPRARLTAVLGPNGAGKTSAIGLLLGLRTPDSGTVEVFGGSPRERAVRQRIGVMLQSAGIQEVLKVRELLELTRSYYPDPRSVADCVALAGLDGLLERRYGALSGGQQRRVQFALAICGRPHLLFLDEPTTGLDIEARQRLWRAIRDLVAEGCSILLTTHYLEEAEALADRVVVIDRGRVIAEGGVASIRARVSQRRIRCLSALPVESVAGWASVSAVRRVDAHLEIVADQAEPVVRRLLEEDAALSELEVRRAGLSEAFLALTAGDGGAALEEAA